MLSIFDGMRLYHGSYCIVEKPQLERCAKQKDFGQGFYLTSSRVPDRLNDQYCLKTIAALDCLTLVRSEKICLEMQ
ncbi:DUF3990 domain-containing protein [Anaerovibrio sp.]|uniref:DUF3990 domain-containing protein n=1 Tax=Anaerovibrio sp. TaxID=1872532 RepID=UPI00388FEA08